MKPTNFETYKPIAGEFAVAQSRTGNNFKPYVPAPHPFAQRIEDFRALKSLWTPNVMAVGK
jgi:hypothetical protein